jgi:hypothetical protein
MFRRIAQLLIIGWLSLCMFSYALGAETQNWKIKIRVDGSGTYGYAVAGVRDTATDAYDPAWDVQAMLDNLNDDAADPFIYVYFPRTDLGVYLSEEAKDPLLPKDWILEVDSNINGQMTITWPDLATKLPDHVVSLIDLDGAGSQTINMQESSSFSFDNTASVVRQFQLTIDEPPVPEPEPYSLTVKLKRKVVNLDWDMAVEEDADQYIVYRSINNGNFEELQRLSIAENQYTDKLEKAIVRSLGQSQLTYKIATVNAVGEVIRSSIEVAVLYISSYGK